MIRLASAIEQVARHRYFYPLGVFAITLVGALIRFGNLSNPHILMFDETYYVKDAYTLGSYGSERDWVDDPNPSFEAGDFSGVLDSAAYVVHPPIGKWIIYLGMLLFGADSPFGWRFAVALLGTLAIPLVIATARLLIGNKFFALSAGLFLALDGLAIAMSRTAILDGILMFLVLLSFYFVVKDHFWWKAKLFATRTNGVVIRPWLIATAMALGLATGVKWSGLYFLAFFGLFTFIADLVIRRRLGLPGVLAIGQGFINALTLILIALVTYILGWLGWILGDDGWGRNSRPGWLAPLWDYHVNAYTFHTGLSSEHPYMANAFSWLVLGRPTAFYFERYEDGSGCNILPECTEAVTALPHPLLWIAGILAVIWLILRSFRKLDLAALAIIFSFLAGWLPWVIYLERTTFIFYAVVLSPFVALALSYGLHHYWRKGLVRHWPWRNRRLTVFYFSVALLALYFLSLWVGYQTPHWVWRIQMWFPWWI